jgi:hypothetical protein
MDDGADILVRKPHVPELQNLKLLRTFGRSIPGMERLADRRATAEGYDGESEGDFAAQRSREPQN